MKQEKADRQQEKTAKEAEKRAEKQLGTAHTRDSHQALSKLCEVVDGKYRIVSQPPVVIPGRDLASTYGISAADVIPQLYEVFGAYRDTLPDDRRKLLERFEVVDAARKVVGVGSVGTRCFIVLLQGRDAQDPLFLQVKEATASVLEPYVRRSRYRQHGERVVQGQLMMQAASTSPGPRPTNCWPKSEGKGLPARDTCSHPLTADQSFRPLTLLFPVLSVQPARAQRGTVSLVNGWSARYRQAGCRAPSNRAWNGSWNGAPDNPSVVGAVSAMIRAIGAAGALVA